MYLSLVSGATAANGIPVAVAATGEITTVAKANLLQGENFTLKDGLGGIVKFVFDLTDIYEQPMTGPVVAVVDLSGVTTADGVRDAIIAAVNAAPIAITASSGGAATVTLTNDYAGPQGNSPIPENVANGTFAATGMANGDLSGQPAGGLGGTSISPDQEDATVLVSAVCTAEETMTATVSIWGYVSAAQMWFRHKALNAGNAIAETSADAINYAETVTGLRQYSRLYAEIVAVAGTGTTVAVALQAKQ